MQDTYYPDLYREVIHKALSRDLRPVGPAKRPTGKDVELYSWPQLLSSKVEVQVIIIVNRNRENACVYFDNFLQYKLKGRGFIRQDFFDDLRQKKIIETEKEAKEKYFFESPFKKNVL